MLDTGADLSLLTMKAAYELGIRDFGRTCRTGVALGGQQLNMLGSAIINVEVLGRIARGRTVQVANMDLQYDLLIGTDLLAELGPFVINMSSDNFVLKPSVSDETAQINVINPKAITIPPCSVCEFSVEIPKFSSNTIFTPHNTDSYLIKHAVDRGDGFVTVSVMNNNDDKIVISKGQLLGVVDSIQITNMNSIELNLTDNNLDPLKCSNSKVSPSSADSQ